MGGKERINTNEKKKQPLTKTLKNCIIQIQEDGSVGKTLAGKPDNLNAIPGNNRKGQTDVVASI